MPRRMILDVDTGTDDAIAIMLAALHPELDLIGCSTVWGNLPVAYTTDNTLRVLDHVGRTDVPVHKGLNKPFAPVFAPEPAEYVASRELVHGRALPIPASQRHDVSPSAVEWLVETLRATTEPITLVPTAPLSNIAAAVTVDPSIVDAVDEIVIMGGARATGNTTASAEANVWHDPVAADVVYQAGFRRLVLVPLDATHQALITSAQCERLSGLGTPAATAAASFIAQRIAGYAATELAEASAPVHDALCVAYLLDPSVVELHPSYLAVETGGGPSYGRTIIDTRPEPDGVRNAYVALAADAARFFEILFEAFSVTTRPVTSPTE